MDIVPCIGMHYYNASRFTDPIKIPIGTSSSLNCISLRFDPKNNLPLILNELVNLRKKTIQGEIKLILHMHIHMQGVSLVEKQD